MDKTELPFTVKDGMLIGPNGSWRIKAISAVFSETKSHAVRNVVLIFVVACAGSLAGGTSGVIVALVILLFAGYIMFSLMGTSSDTLKVIAVVNGLKLALWQKTYGSRSESEVKAQGEALLSLIRGAIEQNANS
jgi:hypothetical protein